MFLSTTTPLTNPFYAVAMAAAVPLLVLTGFGLVATVPVAVLGLAGLFDDRMRAQRTGIALTVGTFSGPFLTWLFRADPAVSLSSLLHPAMGVLIAAAAGATMIAMLRNNRR